MLEFDLPKEQASIIKVIGVGGGGSNAVSHMHQQGIKDVNFVICNTDAQSMELSTVPNKVQLGPDLTEGRGAGSVPEKGRQATEESLAEIESILTSNTKMVFITAGMGGGTGTGGGPVIAKMARDMGILTVGIVTTPFSFEGKKRIQQAEDGIAAMKDAVDTLLVISNDKLREIHGNLTLSEAFAEADNILTVAAKGIAEIITVAGLVNVDFEDVNTVMRNSGVAIMGSATASGEERAHAVVQQALNSPLLNDNDIKGAQQILLNITSGSKEATMDEISEITDYVQEAAGNHTNLIWGHCVDGSIDDSISVTVIATGFSGGEYQHALNTPQERVVHQLDQDPPQTEEPGAVEGPATNGAEGEVEWEVKESEQTVSQTPEEEPEDMPSIMDVEEDVVAEEATETPTAFEQPTEFKDEETVGNNDIVFDMTTESEATEETTEPETQPEEPTTAPEMDFTVSETPKEPRPASSESSSREEVEREPRSFPTDKAGKWPGPTPTEPTLIERSESTTSEEPEAQDDRVKKLKGLSMQLKNPSAVGDLEKEPAYLRRNVELEDQPHSSESNVSKYTLETDEDGKPELRENNSFLHDNVD